MAKIKINWEASGEYTIDLIDSDITLEEWNEFSKSEQDELIHIHILDEVSDISPKLKSWEIIE